MPAKTTRRNPLLALVRKISVTAPSETRSSRDAALARLKLTSLQGMNA